MIMFTKGANASKKSIGTKYLTLLHWNKSYFSNSDYEFGIAT